MFSSNRDTKKFIKPVVLETRSICIINPLPAKFYIKASASVSRSILIAFLPFHASSRFFLAQQLRARAINTVTIHSALCLCFHMILNISRICLITCCITISSLRRLKRAELVFLPRRIFEKQVKRVRR